MPRLSAAAPRFELLALPTPVDHRAELGARLGLADLLVKRDDQTSPLYGGTKGRGLEFFLAQAVGTGRSCVLTLGSAGSNHAVATGIFSREVGLSTRAVLYPHPDAAQADRNCERLAALGVDAWRASWAGVLPALWRARARVGGARPLWITPGGSSVLGVIGAAEGALEVVESARSGAIDLPDDVVVAAGSCGTSAGLVLGFALAGVPVRVVAVRVVPRIVATRARILRLARSAADFLRDQGWSPSVALGEVVVVQTEAGEGYARPTRGAERAVNMAAEAGFRAETTYTGKAWAHVFSGGLKGRKVLFWNTFGG